MWKMLVAGLIVTLTFALTESCQNTNCYPRYQCREGYLIVSGCSTCQCKESLCYQTHCQDGFKCVVMYNYAMQTDYSECVRDETVQQLQPMKEEVVDRIYEEVCRQNGFCDVNTPCPWNYYCRTDGRCCMNETTPAPETTPPPTPPKPNKCMQKPDMGMCRAFGTQYVYRKEDGACVSMTYAACVNSDNSFSTMEECQDQCEKPCHKPQDTGCSLNISRYYYHEELKQCVFHDFGGCSGENALTYQECMTHCPTLKEHQTDSLTIEQTTPKPSSLAPGRIPAMDRTNSLPKRDDILARLLGMQNRRFNWNSNRALQNPVTTPKWTGPLNPNMFGHIPAGNGGYSDRNLDKTPTYRRPSYLSSLQALQNNLG